jgi:hypothetical protein
MKVTEEINWIRSSNLSLFRLCVCFLSRGSAFINPLEVVTEEEKQLFQKGEENKVR